MTVQCSIFQIFIGFLVMSTTQISGVEMTLPKGKLLPTVYILWKNSS